MIAIWADRTTRRRIHFKGNQHLRHGRNGIMKEYKQQEATLYEEFAQGTKHNKCTTKQSDIKEAREYLRRRLAEVSMEHYLDRRLIADELYETFLFQYDPSFAEVAIRIEIMISELVAQMRRRDFPI